MPLAVSKGRLTGIAADTLITDPHRTFRQGNSVKISGAGLDGEFKIVETTVVPVVFLSYPTVPPEIIVGADVIETML